MAYHCPWPIIAHGLSWECGVRSAECGVRSAECGVRSLKFGIIPLGSSLPMAYHCPWPIAHWPVAGGHWSPFLVLYVRASRGVPHSAQVPEADGGVRSGGPIAWHRGHRHPFLMCNVKGSRGVPHCAQVPEADGGIRCGGQSMGAQLRPRPRPQSVAKPLLTPTPWPAVKGTKHNATQEQREQNAIARQQIGRGRLR